MCLRELLEKFYCFNCDFSLRKLRRNFFKLARLQSFPKDFIAIAETNPESPKERKVAIFTTTTKLTLIFQTTTVRPTDLKIRITKRF